MALFMVMEVVTVMEVTWFVIASHRRRERPTEIRLCCFALLKYLGFDLKQYLNILEQCNLQKQNLKS